MCYRGLTCGCDGTRTRAVSRAWKRASLQTLREPFGASATFPARRPSVFGPLCLLSYTPMCCPRSVWRHGAHQQGDTPMAGVTGIEPMKYASAVAPDNVLLSEIKSSLELWVCLVPHRPEPEAGFEPASAVWSRSNQSLRTGDTSAPLRSKSTTLLLPMLYQLSYRPDRGPARWDSNP